MTNAEIDAPKSLPADPEDMNAERSVWAAAALAEFRLISNADHEDALGDLLCDLMHWSDRNNFDFDAALFRAQRHYQAEITPEATEGTEA